MDGCEQYQLRLCDGLGSGSSGSQDCVNGNADNQEVPTNFLHPSGVHIPRIGEFGLKFIF
jgi:hypothetical protein